MFEKNEKLELLKEILGTREDYTETVKNLDLDEKEKEILLLASVHIKKKNIDQKLIDQAYDIVVKKSKDMDDGDHIKDNKTANGKYDKTKYYVYYDILLSPQGDYEAVKKGWSSVAFSTTFVWALLNKMWYLGTILWVLFLFWFSINTPSSLPSFFVFIVIPGLMVGLIFGIKGNEWKKKNLLARGYKKISSVMTSTPERAIAIFMESSGKDRAAINENYNIFTSPQGDYEAVQKGWSWTAFLFTFMWALFNKMWALGGVGWTLWIIWSLFLMKAFSESGAFIIQIPLVLYVGLIFGILGNEWKKKNLLARGYKKISSVTASTSEGAIAIFVELAEKDKDTEELQSEVVVKNSTEPVDKQHLVDELRKLAELKNEGLLTEEEFSAGKNKLLNG